MSVSAEQTDAPQIDFELPEGQSLSEQLAGCLQFSSAFTSVGFETINDSVLREMNERATHQLTQPEVIAPHTSNDPSSSPSMPNARGEWQSPFELRNFQKMTTSPPHTHFSDAHSRQFANSQSLQLSPQAKRLNEGDESPSKRRRAPDGKSVDILHSPTQSLQQINLNASNQIAQASASRQRERQRKELQLSPRRRGQLPGRRISSDNMTSSSLNFSDRSNDAARIDTNSLPDLKPPSGLSGPIPGSFPGMFGAPSGTSSISTNSSFPASHSVTSHSVPPTISSSQTVSAHDTLASNATTTARLPSSRSMRFEQSSRSVSNPSIRPSPSQNDIKNITTSPLGRKPLINTINKQSTRPMSYHVTSNRPHSTLQSSTPNSNGACAPTGVSSNTTSGSNNPSSGFASGRMPRTTSSRQIPEQRARIPSSQSMRHIPNSTSTRTLTTSSSSRQLSASLDTKPTVSRSIPTSQSMRQLPRSQSSRTLPPLTQRSVSSSAANVPISTTSAASANNNTLPSYARPTVASLRYAQATQMSKTSDQLNPGRVRR